MKRLKAIFSSIRTLGRTPDHDITEAWERIKLGIVPAHVDHTHHTAADLYLVEQCIFGVADEAVAYLKKQGEQPSK